MNIAIIDDLKTDSDRLVGLIDTYIWNSIGSSAGPWIFFPVGRPS